eukprot:COSAG01_NODE_7836_length_3033_cov_54.323790_2_plen_113_part_00
MTKRAFPPVPPCFRYYRPNGVLIPDKFYGRVMLDGVEHVVSPPGGGAFDSVAEMQVAMDTKRAQLGWKPRVKAAKQSKMKGVYWNNGKGKWLARVDGKLATRLNGGALESAP